jgi:hypothetical protein
MPSIPTGLIKRFGTNVDCIYEHTTSVEGDDVYTIFAKLVECDKQIIGIISFGFEESNMRIMRLSEHEWYQHHPQMYDTLGFPFIRNALADFTGIMNTLCQIAIEVGLKNGCTKIFDAMLGKTAPYYRQIGFSSCYSKEKYGVLGYTATQIVDDGVFMNSEIDKAIAQGQYNIDFGSFDMSLDLTRIMEHPLWKKRLETRILCDEEPRGKYIKR